MQSKRVPDTLSVIEVIASSIAAVATVGALLAAVRAVGDAKKLFNIESKRDQTAAEDRERQQASKINAWSALRLLRNDIQGFGVIVSNSSEEPVYDVKVAVGGFRTAHAPTLACVPPGQVFVEQKRVMVEVDTFHWDYAKPVTEFADPLRPFSASQSKRVTGVMFTDSSGRQWRRSETGQLERDAVAEAATTL
ncbi:hypothetical protein EDF38_1756 [Frigoribacterium sp. PhB160]|nr:hypothetical protein EDF38_1756 [Frigoribacterium sp. PhB160]